MFHVGNPNVKSPIFGPMANRRLPTTLTFGSSSLRTFEILTPDAQELNQPHLSAVRHPDSRIVPPLVIFGPINSENDIIVLDIYNRCMI